ncbi:PREDICTED: serine-rich adhesin for platelets-like [Dinoponera quadriceps]|uniref:Serine-rich adhesin for platelets-like n=1 Tax=Dinoponera quadriceps TaxID=609295 RepID=A0A6P3X534_DINQU|nr:PREDICTED: serine-rich adhesin for platelets-like [Dinoponera quadriceps]
MAAPQASSRLEMLQARFQQKQLQEKEQKLLQLYDQQQQRAYQVVQRGSAGSNGSNHGSTIRTTTTTHSTSTSQGGKVRQMFDERRQTTVKGIDRSYPLEPLENKLRKQTTSTNGLAAQRNGNLTTVNRQSVNVKRVARADVNSNVNGGKPVVSYREEVTRESFGPSVHRHDDEDEFGSENRVATFANGHHRHDLDNEDEALDQETMERNRMMAKLHLMGFDESLKHRVRNDLDSEEFPEYLMVDVPDKLPKRNVTKKLTQAEARLERFKNANAKRSNNNALKQPSTTGAAFKRRTEQMLPARSNSRGSEAADGASSGSARSGSSRAARERGNPDVETYRRSDNPRSSPEKIGTATWRSYPPDNYFKSLTSDGKIIARRGASPRFLSGEFGRSVDTGSPSADRQTRASRSTSPEFLCGEADQRARGSTMSSRIREMLTQRNRRFEGIATSVDREGIDARSASADRQTRETRRSRSTSPEFFCREDERSATTMMIDRRGSTSSRDREIFTQRSSRRSEETSTSIDRKYAEITRDKRSPSPQFFRRDSERSDATVSISKNVDLRSTDRETRETRASRSTSPEFFRREDERSATTLMIDRRESTSSRDREVLSRQSRRSEETSTSIDRKYAEIARSSSPQFSRRDSERSDATVSISRKNVDLRSVSADRETRETRASRRSTSPEFSRREGEKSATTMTADQRARGHTMSSHIRELLTKRNRRTGGTTRSVDRKYADTTRDKRSLSPPFFLRQSGKSSAPVSIDRKGIHFRSASADRQTRGTRTGRSTGPEFFRKEGEGSATTVMSDRRRSTFSRDREVSTRRSGRFEGTSRSTDRKYAETTREKRSSSSPFSLKGSGRFGASVNVSRRSIDARSASADRETRETSRSTAPEFFCREGERSATTMMIDGRESTSSRDREVSARRSGRSEGVTTSIDRKYSEITRDKRSSSPQFLSKESEKSTTLIEPKSAVTTDSAKSILKRRKYTLDTSYKQTVRPSTHSGNKGARSARVRQPPSPPMSKNVAKKNLKRGEASSVTVRSGSRKSSKISDTLASSASSIVSLKYGLEFDNILQSAGLVRKFMKSQNGGQREAHRRSSSKRDFKTTGARAVKDVQARNRYGVSRLSQKSRSPSTDSRERTTPEYSRKSVTPTESDMEIQEITMTDHRMERCKPRKSPSPEQPASRLDSPNVALRKRTPPRKDYGRRHGAKPNTPPRYSPLGKVTRHGAGTTRTSFSRRVVDQKADRNLASKYGTYTIKGRERKAASVEARRGSPSLSENKARSKAEGSRDTARTAPKAMLTQRGDDSGSPSLQESASRRLDSAGSPERLTRASPEISLRLMDVQTRAALAVTEELKALTRSTVDSSRKVASDVTLRSTLRTSTGEGTRAGRVARKGDSRVIPSKEIRSSRRITKTYRSSVGSKPSSTQRRSPICKRQLFESTSEKKVHGVQTNWRFTETRNKENYSSANVRSRGDGATSDVKSLEDLSVARRSEEPEELPTISVKKLRSIEDIRKSIGHHERPRTLTPAKRSRSAIANWRPSTLREAGDARRSSSASGSVRCVSLKKEPARLTKIQSCVSRIAKSPSPDARKQHETNARATRGSTPSSPSKSPDIQVAPRRGPTEPKSRDARRPVVAKAAESIGSKTTTETADDAIDEVDNAVQQDGSPRESSAKKSDAFVIDLDDRSKESDTTPPKKATSMRRSSNDKYQATSSASGRPTSSVSSNVSSAGTTQSPASGTKRRMSTRTRMSVSRSGSRARELASAKSTGSNPADGRIACNICQRNFAPERLAEHQNACARMASRKKRKPYDAMKARLTGTELEPFLKKSVVPAAKKPEVKSNWRRKHEEFIQTIRSAKMVQSHLAAGGNLKDLPPPPPSDTSDYIQCPHCSRRFNQAAAERHIPKCANMRHNKPAHARAAKTRR